VSDTIQNLIPAADGWRALFGHGSAAQRSRIVGWAVVQGENGSEIVGMVVDPNDPATPPRSSTSARPAGAHPSFEARGRNVIRR
jgi:hypothetical protein